MRFLLGKIKKAAAFAVPLAMCVACTQGSVEETTDNTKTPGQPASKPNVVIILTDDQGYGDMSLHGNPVLKTPNIDQLASDGIELTDFHVDPTCSPTRAALMTGRYSTRVGVWLTYSSRNHLYRDETTMADVFKYNGYRTAIFGKWHLGDNYPFRPEDRGFDESYIHMGGVVGEAPDYWDNDYFGDTYFRNGVPEKAEGYSGDIWFNEAIRFIEKNKTKPFFIYLPTNTPHGPFNVDPSYAAPYLKAGEPSTRARFYGMITTIDDNLAQFRRFLKGAGLDQNTLIVYMTDNGTTQGFEGPRDGYPVSGYNAGMRGGKTSAYEGGHKAAGIIYWPQGGLVGGRKINTLTAQIDLLPTFVDMFGLKTPEHKPWDGTSLAGLLNGNTLAPRDLVVHNQARFGEPVGEGDLKKNKDFVVMRDKWRLVGNELYDLNSDPAQRQDIAEQHPALAKELRAVYEAWWSDVTQDVRYAPVILDPEKQEEVKLTGQAWFGEKVPYDQQHVRNAMQTQGYWMLDSVKRADYLVEVRRWPRESGLSFSAYPDKKVMSPGLDENFPLYKLNDNAIDVREVVVRVNGKEIRTPITGKEASIEVPVTFEQGHNRIAADMIDANGNIYSAYYVYVSPLNGRQVATN